MTDDTQADQRMTSARALWLLMTVSLALAIGVLTFMSPSQLPATPKGADKLQHLIAFGALVFPTALFRPSAWKGIAGLALLYGGLIEIVQPLAGRQADIHDFLANGIGVTLGLLLGHAARHVLFRRKQVPE